MPKFLLGTVTVRTYEVWADSLEDAQKFVLSWQESEAEEPEGGIKVTRYKLQWHENQTQDDVTHDRNIVLGEFLKLMGTIPGMPPPGEIDPEKYESKLIIHPWNRITNPPPSPRSDGS